MGYYNFYSHLNNDRTNPLLTMDQIAKWAVKQNYGLHRLVCALVREKQILCPESELAQKLFEVVDKYTI
jgi:hypothetical protein